MIRTYFKFGISLSVAIAIFAVILIAYEYRHSSDLTPESKIYSGRVVTLDGESIPDAEITTVDQEIIKSTPLAVMLQRRFVRTAHTDRKGRFSIVGTSSIAVAKPGYSVSKVHRKDFDRYWRLTLLIRGYASNWNEYEHRGIIPALDKGIQTVFLVQDRDLQVSNLDTTSQIHLPANESRFADLESGAVSAERNQSHDVELILRSSSEVPGFTPIAFRSLYGPGINCAKSARELAPPQGYQPALVILSPADGPAFACFGKTSEGHYFRTALQISKFGASGADGPIVEGTLDTEINTSGGRQLKRDLNGGPAFPDVLPNNSNWWENPLSLLPVQSTPPGFIPLLPNPVPQVDGQVLAQLLEYLHGSSSPNHENLQ